MQNSELFRRGIVVPLDEDAEYSLRINDVSESTNVRYLSILDDSMFDLLWNTNLFREINSRCQSLIDDYEDEFVEASSADEILAAIELATKSTVAQRPEIAKFLEDMRALVKEAVILSRPVLFVL